MKSLWSLSLSLMITNIPWCSAFVPIRLRGQSPTFLPSSNNYLDDLRSPSIPTNGGNDQKFGSYLDALSTKPASQTELFDDYVEELTKSFDIYVDNRRVNTAAVSTPIDNYLSNLNREPVIAAVTDASSGNEYLKLNAHYLETLRVVPGGSDQQNNSYRNIPNHVKSVPAVNTVPVSSVENYLSNLEPASNAVVTRTTEQTPSSGNKYIKLNAPQVGNVNSGSDQQNDFFRAIPTKVKRELVTDRRVITGDVTTPIDSYLSNLHRAADTPATADVKKTKVRTAPSSNKYLTLNAPHLESARTGIPRKVDIDAFRATPVKVKSVRVAVVPKAKEITPPKSVRVASIPKTKEIAPPPKVRVKKVQPLSPSVSYVMADGLPEPRRRAPPPPPTVTAPVVRRTKKVQPTPPPPPPPVVRRTKKVQPPPAAEDVSYVSADDWMSL